MDRRTAVKLGFLFGPLAAGILALHFGGPALGRAVSRLRSGPQAEMQEFAACRVYASGAGAREEADAILRELAETLASASDGRLGVKPGAGRLVIRLVERVEDLQALRGPETPDTKAQGGWFRPDGLEVALVAPAAARGPETDRRLRHLLAHALLHQAGPAAEWSPWLHEGLAEYFEEGSRGLPGRITRRQISGLASLRDSGALIPLELVLQARAEDFAGPRGLQYYGQAHALVAFLFESPSRREEFLEFYREELRAGPVDAGAFEEMVGDPREVERDWLDWLRRQE